LPLPSFSISIKIHEVNKKASTFLNADALGSCPIYWAPFCSINRATTMLATDHSPLTTLFLPYSLIILRLSPQIISQGLKVVYLGKGQG